METHWNWTLVLLSILIAILHSCVAFDLASRVVLARGRARILLVLVGGLALGIGIWSMHFVGMAALEMPGMQVFYSIPIVILSFAVAGSNSGLSLYLFTRRRLTVPTQIAGAAAMAVAISGMHYIAMYAMRMQATIRWSAPLVALSIGVAFVASLKALTLARRIRDAYGQCVENSSKSVKDRSQLITGSIFMGLAIAGMHYIGMWAATFVHSEAPVRYAGVLGTDKLTTLVASATLVVLILSIASGQIDRALAMSAARLRIEKDLRAHFVAAVIHDLRNPLATALLGLQRLQRKSDRTNTSMLIGTAVKNLQQMDRLVQTLLDAQRISIGQSLPVHVERVELCRLLRDTLESLREAHGDRFTLTCEAETVVEWDPLLVRRAVENLCVNAIKYGSPDRPIDVAARGVDDAMPRVTIDVRNHGPPLSDDEQSDLFQLFKRGRGAEDAGHQGWGLGLFIVKGIAEAHHGSVHVQSTQQTGTVFQLDLPRSALRESASGAGSRPRSGARRLRLAFLTSATPMRR